MTVIKDPYILKDGRVGTIAKSDRVYKSFEETTTEEVDGEIVERTEIKVIFYDIRKKGTGEIYSEAIDVLPYDYEEVSYEEMEAKYGGNQ
jgi:hypothetical protein